MLDKVVINSISICDYIFYGESTLLSKTGIHALRAVMVLSQLAEGAYAGAGCIARKIGAPQNYLGKLLQQLSKDGILISQKGLGGGFRLARNPNQITLFDVIDPIEDISRWSGCILGKNKCSEDNPCSIHHQWKVVRETYLNFLNETTVAELVKDTELVGKVE